MNKGSIAYESMTLREMIDAVTFQELTDSFTLLTGFPTAILDIRGEILVASGWKKICTCFHRKNPKTALRCQRSDTVLASQLAQGQIYNVYKCENGLVDVAVPIIIEGIHMGNLFTGQFFFDTPDMDFFVKQAQEFEFDMDEYLKALEDVPIFSSEQVQQAIQFLNKLTSVIANMGRDKIRLSNLNTTLEQRVNDRTKALEKAIDIRRSAEKEIQKNKQFMDTVFNAIQDGICVLDTDLNIRKVNKVMEQWYPQLQSSMGEKCYTIYHGRSTPCKICPSIRSMQSNNIEMSEIPFWSKDGRKGTHELHSFPIRDTDGQITGVVEYIRDITDRKRIEKQIRIEKRFSESLVNSLPGIMYVFDTFGRMKRWNKNLETVTGYSADQIGTMDLLGFISTADRQRIHEAALQTLTVGEAVIEANLLTSNGEEIPYMLTGYQLIQDRKRYVVGVGLNISDRIHAEKEQKQLIAQLQKALSQVKQLSGFLPICASCKKIRDDEGYWNQIESYLTQHSDVFFSHGLCPECAERLYPEYDIKTNKKE